MDDSKEQTPQADHFTEELEQQVERLGFYTHTGLSVQAERINEIESFLYGLIDTLIADGSLDSQRLEEMVSKVKEETMNKKEHLHAGISLRMDQASKQRPMTREVNCSERLHICKAVCCRLSFSLSIAEVESGKVKWDLGQPYYIRQDKQNYCSHIKKDEMCCSIYHDRPAVCRTYSCAHDDRIWVDFDKMILNEEWIEKNIQPKKVHLQQVSMLPDDKSQG